jgi:membrane dipeptidase
MSAQHPLIILDAHLDIAFNHVVHGRDFRQPALKIRQMEDNRPEKLKDRGLATVGLPDVLLGRVGVAFGTLFVEPAASPYLAPGQTGYQNTAQAYNQAMAQLDYYHRLVDDDGRVILIQTQADLKMVLASWADDKQVGDHKLGIVVSMEGADPVVEPKQVEEWYERGVRAIGLAWTETRYAAGTGRPGPLTRLGHELLGTMGDLNMILDLSHLAEKAYYEALDEYQGVIIASHSNPRRFYESDRNLSDDMIRRLAERDGVIGVALFNKFINGNWTRTDPRDKVRLEHVIEIIDYICQLTGSARHVGIGSDMDGGFGVESIPYPMNTITDEWLLKDLLLKRYDPEDVQAILSGNFLRVLEQSLP